MFSTPLLTRKKSYSGVRTWLLMDSTGRTRMMEAGKHYIMRRTGLPASDLRFLDPFLTYPPSVFGREKAIVVNLDYIKAIIMANDILLMNYKDPFVEPFVQELEKRIICYYQATNEKGQSEDDSKSINNGKCRNEDGSSWFLPFEFIALEACLEAACSNVDNEVNILELEAYPALDKLTSQINNLNLERVHQMKARLVSITERVQKVRDELEHLLDDHDHMARMYLSDKKSQRFFGDSFFSSTSEEDVNCAFEAENMANRFVPPDILPENNGASTSCKENYNGNAKNNILHSEINNASDRESHRTNSSLKHKHSNVWELEMLVEAYFVQIDNSLNKLFTLRECIDDTDDYINIMLDDKQNQLLQMGIRLTTADFIVAFVFLVVQALSMNVVIGFFNEPAEKGNVDTIWTDGVLTVAAISFYVIAVACYKRKRILE